MGVPKFYRWISERYPFINQCVGDATLLPEFDNLYLDMNGILHGCTHPNDNQVSTQLSERDVFLGIFHYIDRIVSQIVRPKRVLYMAIDGVAPRAKMNQQRSRRFRSAKDQADAKRELKDKGEAVDDSSVFDSNCITPGTEFMDKVSRHLRYFVRKKLKEDPLWRGLTVIFSGHEVPGEGEHKIMQYIREEQAGGRFPPNTRHCMYGQDADLILLGLISHEPHFALLREVVDFGGGPGKKNKNAVKVVLKNTRDAKFQLLHMSVLREYLWLEFIKDLAPQVVMSLDRERLIDDFVFMTFLVGNDFLPHMPSLDIGEEAFGRLFDIYRALVPGWNGGYLTEGGELADADRFEEFLRVIGSQEDDIFAKRAIENADFQARLRKNARRFGGGDLPSEEEEAMAEATLQMEYEEAMVAQLGHVPNLVEPGRKDFKGRYYFEKFGITAKNEDVHGRLRQCYLEGLVWCLAYYYKGCISWEWFFPFHYVPMISDLTGLRQVMGRIRFELSQPFLPFEQLLGCLPGASSNFLPKSYAWLMTDPASPIIDFYPEDFKVDQNGKRNPWEAVNLLPFIDSSRLFMAVQQHCPEALLGPQEQERNRHGFIYEFKYDQTASETVISCNHDIGLPDIILCNSSARPVPFSIASRVAFSSQLPPGTIIPHPGFPSLGVLPLSAIEVKPIKLNVFGSESRYNSMVLSIKCPPQLPAAKDLAPKVLGRTVHVNWPMLHEAKIVGISDAKGRCRLREVHGKAEFDYVAHREDQAAQWMVDSHVEQTSYLKGRGIPGSGGADIGQIQVRLTVRPLQGMNRDRATGALTKVFGNQEAQVPLHMVVWKPAMLDPRFQERGPLTVQENFPVGTRAICLNNGTGHGCMASVTGYTQDGKINVTVDLRPPEPPFGVAIASTVQDKYYPAHLVCAKLQMRNDVLGKIVGTVSIDPGRFDLGLNLKANGRYQLQGYSRCILNQRAVWSAEDRVRVAGSAQTEEDREAMLGSWEFSEAAIRLIMEYQQRFPALFLALSSLPHERFYAASALFGAQGERVAEEIFKWLQTVPTAGLPRIPLTTQAMSRAAVQAVQRASDIRQAVIVGGQKITKMDIQGLTGEQLLKYAVTESVQQSSDAHVEKPELGVRVVNHSARGVPFGLWGTVVACHYHSSCVEVVFDEEFMGGGTLQGLCSNYRGIVVPWNHVAKVPTTVPGPAQGGTLRVGAASYAPAQTPAQATPSKAAVTATRNGLDLVTPIKAAPVKLVIRRAPAANAAASASTAPGGQIGGHQQAAQLKALIGVPGRQPPAGQSTQAAQAAREPPLPAPPQTTNASSASLKGMLGLSHAAGAVPGATVPPAAPAAGPAPKPSAASPVQSHTRPLMMSPLQTSVAHRSNGRDISPMKEEAAVRRSGQRQYRQARGPDNSRGFKIGRGNGKAPAAGGAVEGGDFTLGGLQDGDLGARPGAPEEGRPVSRAELSALISQWKSDLKINEDAGAAASAAAASGAEAGQGGPVSGETTEAQGQGSPAHKTKRKRHPLHVKVVTAASASANAAPASANTAPGAGQALLSMLQAGGASGQATVAKRPAGQEQAAVASNLGTQLLQQLQKQAPPTAGAQASIRGPQGHTAAAQPAANLSDKIETAHAPRNHSARPDPTHAQPISTQQVPAPRPSLTQAQARSTSPHQQPPSGAPQPQYADPAKLQAASAAAIGRPAPHQQQTGGKPQPQAAEQSKGAGPSNRGGAPQVMLVPGAMGAPHHHMGHPGTVFVHGPPAQWAYGAPVPQWLPDQQYYHQLRQQQLMQQHWQQEQLQQHHHQVRVPHQQQQQAHVHQHKAAGSAATASGASPANNMPRGGLLIPSRALLKSKRTKKGAAAAEDTTG